jgi:hypothetical protein
MLKFKDFISMSNEQLDEARFIKVNRIRNGVVQRRKIVSAPRGYKIINGKLVRMTSLEKMHRKLAQRKAARKRKPKLALILRKRKKSNLKRFSTGIEHRPATQPVTQHHA